MAAISRFFQHLLRNGMILHFAMGSENLSPPMTRGSCAHASPINLSSAIASYLITSPIMRELPPDYL